MGPGLICQSWAGCYVILFRSLHGDERGRRQCQLPIGCRRCGQGLLHSTFLIIASWSHLCRETVGKNPSNSKCTARSAAGLCSSFLFFQNLLWLTKSLLFVVFFSPLFFCFLVNVFTFCLLQMWTVLIRCCWNVFCSLASCLVLLLSFSLQFCSFPHCLCFLVCGSFSLYA